MWNDTKSILLSRLCIIVFFVLTIAVAISAPWLIDKFIDFSNSATDGARIYFLLTIYTGSVAAIVLLGSLFMLLRRIETGKVFIPKNVESLRHISWCCFIGAMICFVSAFYYYPWALVSVAAAFVALIVRVVKNVFARAISLQDDVDFTI